MADRQQAQGLPHHSATLAAALVIGQRGRGLTTHGTKGSRQQVDGCRRPELLELKSQRQRKPTRPDQATHRGAAAQLPGPQLLICTLETTVSSVSKQGHSSLLPAFVPSSRRC